MKVELQFIISRVGLGTLVGELISYACFRMSLTISFKDIVKNMNNAILNQF